MFLFVVVRRKQSSHRTPVAAWCRPAAAVVGLAVFSVMWAPADAGDVTVSLGNAADCGWLDQHFLARAPVSNPGLAAEACAPSSVVNALVYLERTNPTLFGTSVTGTDQASWSQTAKVLATDYLHTQYGRSPASLNGTTPIENLPIGTGAYLQARGYGWVSISGLLPQGVAGGPIDFFVGTNLPSTYGRRVPAWQDLQGMLGAGTPVILSLLYTNAQGGHNVLLTGLTRHDDGSGTITFVDPLDPCSYDSAGLPAAIKFSTGNVATSSTVTLAAGGTSDTLTDVLTLTYDQYQGALPYASGSYGTANAWIGGATVIAVPEPATWILVGIAAVGLACRRGLAGRP